MPLFYDFHTHILPKFDDGASSPEESIMMLEMLKKQGVRTVLLTSHYMSDYGSIDSFLKKRAASLAILKKCADEAEFDLPNLVLGAEATLSTSLMEDENIAKLCIGNTDTLLLELPITHITQWTIKYIEKILEKDIKVVIAHHERNLYSNSVDTLKQLKIPGVYFQINASSIISQKNRKAVKQLIKNGMAHVVGTDSHNMDSRKPNLFDANICIEKYFGIDFITYFNTNSRKLLDNQPPLTKMPKLKKMVVLKNIYIHPNGYFL